MERRDEKLREKNVKERGAGNIYLFDGGIPRS
jgi:hypothetical protein